MTHERRGSLTPISQMPECSDFPGDLDSETRLLRTHFAGDLPLIDTTNDTGLPNVCGLGDVLTEREEERREPRRREAFL